MVFQSRKNGVKSSLNFERSYKVIGQKLKNVRSFCGSALLLSFCENRFGLSQLIKKLNSTERGALFRHFSSPRWSPLRMRTKVVSFFIFSRSFQTKKIKALWPKITKIASRGGGASCLKLDRTGPVILGPAPACKGAYGVVRLTNFIRPGKLLSNQWSGWELTWWTLGLFLSPAALLSLSLYLSIYLSIYLHVSLFLSLNVSLSLLISLCLSL